MRNDEAAIIALCRSKSQNLSGIPLDRDGIVSWRRKGYLEGISHINHSLFLLGRLRWKNGSVKLPCKKVELNEKFVKDLWSIYCDCSEFSVDSTFHLGGGEGAGDQVEYRY